MQPRFVIEPDRMLEAVVITTNGVHTESSSVICLPSH